MNVYIRGYNTVDICVYELYTVLSSNFYIVKKLLPGVPGTLLQQPMGFLPDA